MDLVVREDLAAEDSILANVDVTTDMGGYPAGDFSMGC